MDGTSSGDASWAQDQNTGYERRVRYEANIRRDTLMSLRSLAARFFEGDEAVTISWTVALASDLATALATQDQAQALSVLDSHSGLISKLTQKQKDLT